MPRLKLDNQDTFYHTHNRVAGCPGDYPFGAAEKDHFVRLLHRLAALYTVEVLGYCVMGNHFHLLLRAPSEVPSDEEACRRYNAYHGGGRTLAPGTRECRRIAARLRDISWLMRDLQQQFTVWFNRTRPVRRRGTLWAGRYKHTILERGRAVWDCWKYLLMNPVRARLAADAADYRFSDLGAWQSAGTHPFQGNLDRHLVPCIPDLVQHGTHADILAELRRESARAAAEAAGQSPEADGAPAARTDAPAPFATGAARRVRHWTDGLVIGTASFVRTAAARPCGGNAAPRLRLAPAVDMADDGLRLYACRHVRALSR